MPVKLTIITPTYNRAEFLPKTIDSVINQSFIDLEYLIIDDGSQDDTRHIVEQYKKIDPRITYIKKENGGEASAVNCGWQASNGTYIVIVNSDDPQPLDLFEKLVGYMDKNPEIAVGYPNWSSIDIENNITKTYTMDQFDYEYMLCNVCGFPGPGAILNKELLTDVSKLRDGKFPYVTDLGCWLKLGQKYKFGVSDKGHAWWREHEDGLTSKLRGNKTANDLYKMMLDYWENHAEEKYKPLKRKSMSMVSLKCARQTYVAKDLVKCLGYLFKSMCWSPKTFLKSLLVYFNERCERDAK